MDLDAIVLARRAEWAELDRLSSLTRPDGAQTDALIARYRSASGDLADIKTSAGRTSVGDHLSTLLARARFRLTGVRPDPVRALVRFFVLQLPAALYRVRWTTLAVAAAFILVAALAATWIAGDPEVVAMLGSNAQLAAYANEQFTGYYTENPAAVFAGTVWTNNAFIAAQCVLFGVTGVWPVWVIMQNAVTVGTAGGVLASFGRTDVFLLHILPHGMLELTCIFVAGAAGLHVFWAWIAPGRRTRAAALAAAGRSLAIIAIGLLLALGLAGLVEGFVTGAPWPWPVKIGLGALALAVFLVYMLVLGRRAVQAGEDGDMTEYETGTPTLTAG